jgi:predicted Zn-ribbon and HTH transcriptional regulator
MKHYICKRCGHDWYSRLDKPPRTCPRCKSYQWRIERQKKEGEEK